MSKSVQLFVEKVIDEEELVKYLNEHISGGVESIDCSVDDARYFVQLQEYSEGFGVGVNISWRDEEDLGVNEKNLASNIARNFFSNVMWESDEDGEWYLVNSEGEIFSVGVVELEDGLTVDGNVDRIKLN